MRGDTGRQATAGNDESKERLLVNQQHESRVCLRCSFYTMWLQPKFWRLSSRMSCTSFQAGTCGSQPLLASDSVLNCADLIIAAKLVLHRTMQNVRLQKC